MHRLLCTLLILAPVFTGVATAAPAATKRRPPKKTPPKPPIEPAPTPEPTPDPPPEPIVAPTPEPGPEPVGAKPPEPPAKKPDSNEEEVTDFDAEEKKMDERTAPPTPVMPPSNGAGGPPGRGPQKGGDAGYKLIVDLLAWHTFGTKQFSFFPNHTLVIMMLNISERISLQLHIAPDPTFYELAFAVTPTFLIKVGKMLVPFGTNNFHHIIGGRVDQASLFLPETWSDYGVGINHLLVDTKYVSVEYDAYVVNGFGGGATPVIGNGTITDNNFMKGIGARAIVGLPKGIRVIGSAYHSMWNVNNDRHVLYYAVGASIPVGAINLPVLNRIGLRGEWSRGELQYEDNADNVQRGILPHASAKAGWYGELTIRAFDFAALRIRAGRVNPDNTVNDVTDIETLEPAIVIGSPKLAFIGAWQATRYAGKRYSPLLPPDVVYAKVFLQY
jgi:hypothetical protein